MIPKHQGALLSDRQIKRLCTPPNFMVTHMVHSPQDPLNDVFMLPHAELRPSWETQEALDKQFEAFNAQGRGFNQIPPDNRTGVKTYRLPTGEELAAFKPMIEPFEPQQVRHRERNATAHEQIIARQFENPEAAAKELKVASIRHDHTLGFRVVEKIVSYGLSSYGYDVTVGNKFKIFTNVNSAVVDPKNFDANSFVDVETTAEKPYVIIPPNSFALAATREYFRIPRDVLTVCLGKSTYARCGIIVNVTPFEPEWEGYVTLEFSNTTPLPAKIYANEGVAQVLFFQGNEDCEVSYKDRNGKYMGQIEGPVTPKL